MEESGFKIKRLELIARHFIKELKTIFSDRGALLILIGATIIYPLIYSIAYFNEVMTDLKIGVVDLDQSTMSRKYMQILDASQEVKITKKPNSLLEAEDLFMQNKIEGVIVIPNNFQKNILQNQPGKVAVYADASYFLKYRNAYLTASITNSYFGAGISILRYMVEGESFDQAKVAIDPLPVHRHVLYNPSSGYASYLMPGLILIIMQQTLLLGIGILGGSFSESKTSPFIFKKGHRKKELIPYIAGKTGAYLLISLINIIFGGILIHHWFSYPDKAKTIEILALTLPFVLSVTFLGIGLSTLFKHRESAIVFMVFLSPIALFLSGLSWPLSSVPDWLVQISRLIPSSTVVPAYLRLRTMGVGLSGVKNELLFLYGQAAFYGFCTIVYFHAIARKNKLAIMNA